MQNYVHYQSIMRRLHHYQGGGFVHPSVDWLAPWPAHSSTHSVGGTAAWVELYIRCGWCHVGGMLVFQLARRQFGMRHFPVWHMILNQHVLQLRCSAGRVSRELESARADLSQAGISPRPLRIPMLGRLDMCQYGNPAGVWQKGTPARARTLAAATSAAWQGGVIVTSAPPWWAWHVPKQ